jgi:hypothetical protein
MPGGAITVYNSTDDSRPYQVAPGTTAAEFFQIVTGNPYSPNLDPPIYVNGTQVTGGTILLTDNHAIWGN